MKKKLFVSVFLAAIAFANVVQYHITEIDYDYYETIEFGETKTGRYLNCKLYLEKGHSYTINATYRDTEWNPYKSEYEYTNWQPITGVKILSIKSLFTKGHIGNGLFHFTVENSGNYIINGGWKERGRLTIYEGMDSDANQGTTYKDMTMQMLFLAIPAIVLLCLIIFLKEEKINIKKFIRRVITFKPKKKTLLYAIFLIFICTTPFMYLIYWGTSIPYGGIMAFIFAPIYGIYLFLFLLVNLILKIRKKSKTKKFKKKILNYLKTATDDVPIKELAINLNTSNKDIIAKITKLRTEGKIEGIIKGGKFIIKKKANNFASQPNPAQNNQSMATNYISKPQSSAKIQEKIDQKHKTRLFGMIKAYKRLNLDNAAKTLNLPLETIQNLLFELLGENKISGGFDGKEFVFSGDVDLFINALDSQFDDWSDKEFSKEGKVESSTFDGSLRDNLEVTRANNVPNKAPQAFQSHQPVKNNDVASKRDIRPINTKQETSSMEENHCPHCGEELPFPESKFCFVCGNKINR